MGDRAGHDLLDAAFRPRRHAVEGIHEAVGDDIHVGRGQVEVEVPVDAVDAIGLRAGGLVRADEDAVDLAAVVRRRAGVAGDGDLPIERLHRIERLGDEVLMDHGDDRDVESHHGTDLRGVVAGGVDDVLADDAALLGDDFPSTVGQCVHVGDAVFPDDLRTQLASTLRQGIGGTGGVGPAVVRRPQRGLDVVDVLHERIELANFVSADDLVLDTEPIQLGADLTVPEHVLVGDCEPQGTAAVPARRQSGLLLDRRVERDGLLVDLGHVEVTDEIRHETGGMPGRARSELALLDQDRVRTPALVGEVVQQADPHCAAADDHDTRVASHDDSPRFDRAHDIDLVNAITDASGPLRIPTIGRGAQPCGQLRVYPAVAPTAADCSDPAMAELTDPLVDSGDRSAVEAMFGNTLTSGYEAPPLARKD